MGKYTKDFAENAIKKAESNMGRCDFKAFTVNIKRAVEHGYASLYEDNDTDTMLEVDEKVNLLIDKFHKKCSCSKK